MSDHESARDAETGAECTPQRQAGLDFGFRPASYWAHADPVEAILADIKGEVRRRRIRELLESGEYGSLPEEMLAPLLEEEARAAWGQIHPLFMGGEYLPPDLPGETAIVRIALASTTGDVQELRARPVPGGIRYRFVDEYETRFWMPFRESRDPLTAAELVRLLDESIGMGAYWGVGLVFQLLVRSYGRGPYKEDDVPSWRHRVEGFVRVESRFYAGLAEWYAWRIERWVDRVTQTWRTA